MNKVTCHEIIEATAIATAPAPLAKGGAGYRLSRFNATRHAVLSSFVVLPWEDQRQYRALLDGLAAEHRPEGPTEEHLVEELAGVLWRKRRLRLAETAVHTRGLGAAFARAGVAKQAETAASVKIERATVERIHGQVLTEEFIFDQLERLMRYEIALDRRFSHLLSMLLRLQELRRAAGPA